MAYVPAYTEGDFKSIIVDGMGTAGASVIGWVDLIILLVILGFIVGTFIRLGGLLKR